MWRERNCNSAIHTNALGSLGGEYDDFILLVCDAL
jgi:hypothetical protein